MKPETDLLKKNAGMEDSRLFYTTAGYATDSGIQPSVQEVYQLLLVESWATGSGLLIDGRMIVLATPCLLFLPPIIMCRQELSVLSRHAVPAILFDQWLLHSQFALKQAFTLIRSLLSQAVRGLVFSGEGFEEHQSRFLCVFNRKNGTFDDELAFLSLLFHLSTCTYSTCIADVPVQERYPVAEGNPRLEQICRYIRENHRQAITLKEVSDAMLLSIPSIHLLFRRQMHCTFTEYLNAVRIEHACTLLLDEEKIPYVAYDCGFQTLSHFFDRFKRQMKMTPSEYRAMYGRGKG